MPEFVVRVDDFNRMLGNKGYPSLSCQVAKVPNCFSYISNQSEKFGLYIAIPVIPYEIIER